jgi:transposase InsO family protein
VGPLPKTKKGHKYLLTIMCASTRFPEAIPLRSIKSPIIIKALEKFFAFVGLPKEIQSDQGSNFMSHEFQQAMCRLGIKQIHSSPYHPQSQGALERYHQTLKSMIKKFCIEQNKDWDEGVHWLLFATREVASESLGFSPFELIFGHSVRGPLKVLKEQWLTDQPSDNILDYYSDFKERLKRSLELAHENLKQAQETMKGHYDKNAKERKFEVGDNVLVFLPIVGHPFQAKYFGPYLIKRKVNDYNYIIEMPDRRKTERLCHINMLKEYNTRSVNININNSSKPQEGQNENYDKSVEQLEETVGQKLEIKIKLKNSEILENLDEKLKDLSQEKVKDLRTLFDKYKPCFRDNLGRTTLIEHSVEIENSKPIKQHSYRANPEKLRLLRNEIKYMLENDLIEESQSNWSSPCILVPKPDGSVRLCIDYRKVNQVTKADSYPLPRIEDCIDKIGQSKFVTKIDLQKGYWQVPLSEDSKEVSAFVTPDGLYQCKVLPFGMKNAPAVSNA